MQTMIQRQTNLLAVLEAPLPVGFRIPLYDTESIPPECADTFVRGKCSYGAALDQFLTHIVMTSTSEVDTVALDYCWLSPIYELCGVDAFLDEHDPASSTYKRPNFSFYRRDVLVLKIEAKGVSSNLQEAKRELSSKFHPLSLMLFPKNQYSIFGIASSRTVIEICEIRYNVQLASFETVDLAGQRYRVDHLEDRVKFIVAIFNVMRWIVSISESQGSFHLKPDRRTKTTNGHFVTLLPDRLRKEYRGAVTDVSLERIQKVYEHRLQNVEWGSVNLETRTSDVTRIGSLVETVIRQRKMSKESVIAGVRAGVEQLHRIGFAHCDIAVQNVFVDLNGVVFLDDLEYVTPVDHLPPHYTRLPRGGQAPKTAEELDWLQFSTFELEVNSL
jgi:hypothetical protein